VVRPLKLYEDYTRQEVHGIFAPETTFTPQSGTWGLQGIIAIPDREGDFVFFVTFGKRQGQHTFEEVISLQGVLTWQSQPKQSLNSRQIQQVIHHDSDSNSIYLFLRTKADRPYTYLGRLKYLNHDSDREQPVYFNWQILDWNMPEGILAHMELTLSGGPLADWKIVELSTEPLADISAASLLVEQVPPARTKSAGNGLPTKQFQSKKLPDYARRDAANRNLGRAGELFVFAYEKAQLIKRSLVHLAEMVEHTADIEGDGAGFDVRSFHFDGSPKFIEVKTTRGDATTDFYVSRNESSFSQQHPNDFYIYRVYSLDPKSGAKFYMVKGALSDANFSLVPIQFRVAR